jgi:hypothetical protein
MKLARRASTALTFETVSQCHPEAIAKDLVFQAAGNARFFAELRMTFASFSIATQSLTGEDRGEGARN